MRGLQANDFKDLKVAILGYGREGRSTHRWLKTHAPSTAITVCDAREQKLEHAADSLFGEAHDDRLSEFDVVVRSPGVPLRIPALEELDPERTKLTSASNIFFANCPGRTIGITGTKGKSTTSSLLTAALQRDDRFAADVRLLGNIGKPALDGLEDANSETTFVLELSSFQTEDLEYSPDLGVFLEVFPEHLDHHRSLENYVAAKQQLFRNQSKDQVLIVSEASLEHAVGDAKRVVVDSQFAKKHFALDERTAYAKNISATVTAAMELEIDIETIVEAVREFSGLPHRLEFVGTYAGINFYNDSLATIPEATISAIRTLGHDVQTLILGGHNRGIDYDLLARELLAHQDHIDTLILFPETGSLIEKAVQALNAKETRLVFEHASNMAEAVSIAFKVTEAGRICALSPASSSLNMFRDYEDRGRQFRSELLSHNQT